MRDERNFKLRFAVWAPHFRKPAGQGLHGILDASGRSLVR